ncbi:5,6-dimethylbenzimidazole synthase [Nitrospira moscoviensis]|uniref:Putative Cob(II)yrinic acid a,c-diamide reductase n=1 Tax=Nitrospira moscoviensis TaxID=42253 RepID=A0A0K2GBK7_NITMO|nr:5,6-dimethylbenzimidazole synthase [Nitrospira moscoviensis]ALA58254.1 putative Cob(II)yrinic acid a,c-diamide reductase [Nitrospira moscoviensis]
MRSAGRFSNLEREAVYRSIFERRDVRKNFLPAPIPDDVLTRLLTAAHHAGSVGFMQPWDFVVIRDRATKRAVKDLFDDANAEAAGRYTGAKAELYRRLKLEGIEEAPVNLCVTCSRRRGGLHVLGRSTVRETDLYSTCCAIQNLWLAARAEGIGVGWVSILDHGAVKRILGIPRPVKVLAYLCLGYVSEFAARPDLETAGWRSRIPVEQLIHSESWGNRMQGVRRNVDADHEGVHANRRCGADALGRRAAGVEGQSQGRRLRHGR